MENPIDYWYQKYLKEKLTWEDVAAIDQIILDVNNELAVDSSKEIDRKKFYEEVLQRFKELIENHNM